MTDLLAELDLIYDRIEMVDDWIEESREEYEFYYGFGESIIEIFPLIILVAISQTIIKEFKDRQTVLKSLAVKGEGKK